MGRKLNLGHLSEDECEKILQVIQRDFELRQKEKERLGKIEEEISVEDNKVAILAQSENFNENCCMRCFSKFFFILNQKVQCLNCGYFVCKKCALYREHDKKYICNVCDKQVVQKDVLTVQACNWFYTNVKKKFKRFGSAKVVRSLYKRKTDSESDIDSGYDPSLHSNSLPVGKRSRPNIEEIIKHRSTPTGNKGAGSDSDDNDTPVSSTTARRTCNAAYSREVAARLESFDAVASKEIERFKHHLNNTVDALHHTFENQVPPGSDLSKQDSEHFEHLLESQRHHIIVALTNLSQSLHLAIDHETLAEPLSSPTKHHYVRHLITKQIEEYVGDPIDVGDEQTSEYASEDGSTSEHSTVFEDSLADAIINKVIRDFDAQRHLEEENNVRRDLTALSNQCTITQLHDELSTYTESETDEPHSSTQTSINIETDVESHFSDMRDSDSVTSETCFDKQIDSEVEYSVHQSGTNAQLTKSESTDTLMSDDWDLDQLVLNNSDVTLQSRLTASPDHRMSRDERDVDVEFSQMADGFSHSAPVTREYIEQVSASPGGDLMLESACSSSFDESLSRAHLSADMALPGNVFEDDEESAHEVAFQFLQNHKPSLPNFGDEDEDEQREVVDLDDISQFSRSGLTLDIENPDDDDGDTVDAENNVEITRSRSPHSPGSTTMESEILFGSAWNTKRNGSHLFKNQNVITPYDNIGEKKVGKDSSGPIYMFVPKDDEPMSPRVGENGSRDVEELSDFSSVRSSEEDDLSLPGSDVEDQEEGTEIKDEVDSQLQEKLACQTEIEAVVEQVTMTSASMKRVHFAKSDENLNSALAPRKSVDLPAEEFSKLVAVAMSKKLEADDDDENEDGVDPEDADPRFTLPPKSQTVPIGDTAKFICQVAGSEPLDVFWYRDMVEVQQIEDTEHYELQHKENGKFVLEVFNTTMEDAGQYLCIAVNDKGQTHKSMKLKLTNDLDDGSASSTPRPENDNEKTSPEFLKGIQDVETVEGRTVKFRCKVRGYPQPRVLWYKDGKRIHNRERASIEKIGNRDYMLTLESVTLEDDAEYVVIARNASGEARSTAQLLVEASGDQEDDDQVFDANRPLPANLTGASDALYPETDELLRIAEQVHAARSKVTATAEDVLQSADHVTSLQRQLDEMDRALENIEDDVRTDQGNTYDSLFYDSENNNDLLSDSLRASILEHTNMQSAARNIRNMTSSALDVLTSTQQIIRSEKPESEDSSDLMSFDETQSEPAAPKRKTDDVEPSGGAREMEEHVIPKLQKQEDTEEEFHLSFAEFEVLYKMGVITREQMRKGKVHSRDLQRIQKALDEYYAEQSEEADVSHDLNSDGLPAAIDCGLKRVDSKRYKRDYVINRNSPQPNRKKWEVQEPWAYPAAAEIVKATPAGEREQVSLDETEEEIYMAAGKVFSLEDRIKLLEERVASADETPESLARLEDEVARYAAKVKHSDDKVVEVERHVELLQKQYAVAPSNQSVTDSTESGEMSINSQSEDEKLAAAEGGTPDPILLRGISSEEDVPESRTECDEELALPSVKSLRSKFNVEDDPASVRRVPTVHSLTGRDLPPTIREKLRRQNPATVHNANIRTTAQPKRPDISSLFEVTDVSVKEANLSVAKQKEPRSSTPLFNNSQPGSRGPQDHHQSYLDQSSIMASPPQRQSTSLDSSLATSPHQPIIKQNKNPSLQRHSQEPIKTAYTSASKNPSVQSHVQSRRSTGSIDTSKPSSSAPKKNRKSAIMARAAFWDTRINEGKVKDEEALEDFPEMPQYSFKSADES